MSTTPDSPDSDSDGLIPFADDPPPAARPEVPRFTEPRRGKRPKRRPAEELVPIDPDLDPLDSPDDATPKSPEEIGERILNRAEEETGFWWVVPVGLTLFGLALCLVPIGVVTAEVGLTRGAGLLALTFVAVLVQVVAVTVFLMVVGTFFGIDYGPALEAIVKLGAVVTVVDGLTAVMLLCNPCGLVLAAIVGVGVFQYLFRLAIFETLLSVAGMVAAAWILNAAVVSVLLSKQKPAANELQKDEIPIARVAWERYC